MTKPSEEFKKWLDIVVEDNFNFAKNPPIDWPHISWLAYLEGRDARPVVVPGLKQFPHGKRFVCTCDFIVHNYVKPHKYCGNCGAKLDWSKTK